MTGGYSVPATAADLDSLVSLGIQESWSLEFKSIRSLSKQEELKKELPKMVSAFANAGGGSVIFGIEESETLPHRAGTVKGRSGDHFDEKWFEDVLTNTISPQVPNVRVQSIVHPSGAVYVIHVPMSLIAPHQSSDGKYYARRQFRQDVLEHFEIEMLRQRSVGVDFGVFGGIAIERSLLVAKVENERPAPIYNVRLQFDKTIPDRFQRSKLFDAGISVVPARSKFSFLLGTVHEAISDDIMSADLPYQFRFKIEPLAKDEVIIGRIHLAELGGASIGGGSMDEVVGVLKRGFSQLTEAFQSIRR